MRPWKTDQNLKNSYTINANNNWRQRAVLFVIVLNILLCRAGADVTKTFSLSAPLQTAIASSMPLWGGGTMIAAIGSELSNRTKLHHFDNLECGTCHSVTPTENNINSSTNDIWKSGVDINRSCTISGCHTYEESMNHPVGITASGTIPAYMKTDSSSRITCITCHENPQAMPDMDGSATADTSERFLQTPNDPQFCDSCHLTGASSLKSRSHARFSNKAHLAQIKAGNSFQMENATQLFASVDEESNNCLSCHDTISVVTPAMNETLRQRANRYKNMHDHPIGMNYQHKATAKMGNFNFPMDNSNVIRLFEGRVGCGSCHSLYSKKDSNLTVDYKTGSLCRSCHIR